jgi:ribonuclease Z
MYKIIKEAHMDKHETEVLFLGTSSCTPDLGNDTASFLINKKYLFDTGWSVVSNLRLNGIDPIDIKYLLVSCSWNRD